MRDERELIRRAGQGDQDAFRQLVETYQAPAYRLALRMCGGDAALAEDAAQEAFLAAWRGLPRFRGDSRFSTWLYRLTTNAAIDCLRREKRHRDTDDLDGVELPDGGDTPQESAERSETQTAVRAALSALSEEHRQVLLLRYMQELDYSEIAVALAEDAAQEAFLAAWRGLPRFRGDSRFSTWLYRLTTNAAIDCLRREKRHRDTDDLDGVELPDGGDTPQESAERSETQTAVRAALSALSEEHRQVLLLRYMQELDYGEIAAALDVSEGTVKSRISRAKARLKELLSGGGNLSAVISVKTAGEEGQK